mgnify:CR=1 FL=1
MDKLHNVLREFTLQILKSHELDELSDSNIRETIANEITEKWTRYVKEVAKQKITQEAVERIKQRTLIIPGKN